MLGNPRKAVISMAMPLLVCYLVVQFNTLMDVSWCAGLGDEASSAVSSMAPLCWVVTGLGIGMGVGSAAAIAARLGTGDFDRANKLATQTLFLTLVLSVVFIVVLLVLVDPIIDMMGIGEIRPECHSYVVPMILFSMPLIFNGTVAGMLRGEGAARKSTYVLVIAAVTHLILDPVLIYGLNMGLTGAAVATAIGMGLGAIAGLYWYLKGKMVVHLERKYFRYEHADAIEILQVGIPRTFEVMLIALLSMMQRIFIVDCGGWQGVMLYNVPWNFVSMCQSISLAFGAALVPIVAAALAEGQGNKAIVAYRHAMKLTLFTMAAVAAVIFVFADFFAWFFSYSGSMEQYHDEFTHVIRIYMLLVPCMGGIDVASSMLQGMRRSMTSLLMSLIRNIIILGLLIWTSNISLYAIFWSVVASEFIGVAMMA